MFELETRLKSYADVELELDISLPLSSAREIQDQFIAMRQALRRIKSLDDKNLSKYAKAIAEEGLRLSHAS